MSFLLRIYALISELSVSSDLSLDKSRIEGGGLI